LSRNRSTTNRRNHRPLLHVAIVFELHPPCVFRTMSFASLPSFSPSISRDDRWPLGP
jgi:hypothetical protein